MIYSLNTTLKPIVANVKEDNSPVSYSWGNIDALHKWLNAMDKRTINAVLEIEGGKKYPLVWLAEGWVGKRISPGIKFDDVVFYISRNSKEEDLNDNRIESFEKLYVIANTLITELKRFSRIKDEDISYYEKPCFNTVSPKSEDKGSVAYDIWDTLIVRMNIHFWNTKYCNH